VCVFSGPGITFCGGELAEIGCQKTPSYVHQDLASNRRRRLYQPFGKWYTPAMMGKEPFSLYLHIPFCRHRCGYCDFNTYAGLEGLIDVYCQALRRELVMVARSTRKRLPVHTIFFGGGTPSLLPASEIAAILETIDTHYQVSEGAEISLEANPGTVSRTTLENLRTAGINRLSFGVQSVHDDELRVLEREHSYFDVIQAVKDARLAGFDNLNLDLIFGLPAQALESWQKTLDLAMGLAPEHFALYALTLEHGTPMLQWAQKGLIPWPDPDLAADMYEWALARLASAGYEQYEISNWARRSKSGELRACLHNLQYWRSLPYLGFGAGAHGYAAGVRTANVLGPAAYIQRMMAGESMKFPRTPATVGATQTAPEMAMGEMMMMGLRLTEEGVADDEFVRRFGMSLQEAYEPQITRVIKLGLLEWVGEKQNRLRLTQAGRLLGNQVFVEFI
jgi:oxygen-independent coproporphyrinogen III oxidase